MKNCRGMRLLSLVLAVVCVTLLALFGHFFTFSAAIDDTHRYRLQLESDAITSNTIRNVFSSTIVDASITLSSFADDLQFVYDVLDAPIVATNGTSSYTSSTLFKTSGYLAAFAGFAQLTPTTSDNARDGKLDPLMVMHAARADSSMPWSSLSGCDISDRRMSMSCFSLYDAQNPAVASSYEVLKYNLSTGANPWSAAYQSSGVGYSSTDSTTVAQALERLGIVDAQSTVWNATWGFRDTYQATNVVVSWSTLSSDAPWAQLGDFSSRHQLNLSLARAEPVILVSVVRKSSQGTPLNIIVMAFAAGRAFGKALGNLIPSSCSGKLLLPSGLRYATSPYSSRWAFALLEYELAVCSDASSNPTATVLPAIIMDRSSSSVLMVASSDLQFAAAVLNFLPSAIATGGIAPLRQSASSTVVDGITKGRATAVVSRPLFIAAVVVAAVLCGVSFFTMLSWLRWLEAVSISMEIEKTIPEFISRGQLERNFEDDADEDADDEAFRGESGDAPLSDEQQPDEPADEADLSDIASSSSSEHVAGSGGTQTSAVDTSQSSSQHEKLRHDSKPVSPQPQSQSLVSPAATPSLLSSNNNTPRAVEARKASRPLKTVSPRKVVKSSGKTGLNASISNSGIRRQQKEDDEGPPNHTWLVHVVEEASLLHAAMEELLKSVCRVWPFIPESALASKPEAIPEQPHKNQHHQPQAHGRFPNNENELSSIATSSEKVDAVRRVSSHHNDSSLSDISVTDTKSAEATSVPTVPLTAKPAVAAVGRPSSRATAASNHGRRHSSGLASTLSSSLVQKKNAAVVFVNVKGFHALVYGNSLPSLSGGGGSGTANQFQTIAMLTSEKISTPMAPLQLLGHNPEDFECTSQASGRSGRNSQQQQQQQPTAHAGLQSSVMSKSSFKSVASATSHQVAIAKGFQSKYADFVEKLLLAVKKHKGVVDFIHGDHVLVSFNATTDCLLPGKAATNCVFQLQHNLQSTVFDDVECGIAMGSCYCGFLGTDNVRRPATVGLPVSAAVELQRTVRKCPSSFEVRCLTSSRVARELQHEQHYLLVGTALLPDEMKADKAFGDDPLNHLVESSRQPIYSLVAAPSLDRSSLHRLSTVKSNRGNGEDGDEWLYEVGKNEATNPYTRINAVMLQIVGGNMMAAEALFADHEAEFEVTRQRWAENDPSVALHQPFSSSNAVTHHQSDSKRRVSGLKVESRKADVVEQLWARIERIITRGSNEFNL